jgi:hypothetical protein
MAVHDSIAKRRSVPCEAGDYSRGMRHPTALMTPIDARDRHKLHWSRGHF